MTKIPKSVLEAAILAEAPKQWERFQKNKLKREKGKPKWQREIDAIGDEITGTRAKADELWRRYDPELTRITANLDRKMGSSAGGLRCPKCGESDMHNTMNGRSWCLRCNVALESPFLVKKRMPNAKVLPKTRKLDVTFRRLDE